MTTATPVKTETYTVTYVVEVPHRVTLVAPAGSSAEEVEALVTRDDLANGEMETDLWDAVKEADPRSVTTESGDVLWID